MTEKDFHAMIQPWENLALMVRYISDYPEYLDLLMVKTFDDSRPENWRAAWMVDKIHEKHPEMIEKYLPEMIDFVMQTKNTGKKRHLLKLISLFEIPEASLGILLNFCIDVFTDAREPVAVRVHAMQVLFNIAQKEPDFAGELTELIENELDLHGSAGMNSRGKKLLAKLRSARR